MILSQRALAAVLALAPLLLVQQALGFSTGPGGCDTPPVGGLHLVAPTVIERTLENAGISVSIDGTVLSPGPSVRPLVVGAEVSVVVAASEGLTYRGILIRVERADGVDTTGSLMSEVLGDAIACVAPVSGVGHLDSDDKSTSSAMLRVDDVVDATVQVTVVFSNSGGVSSYAFDEFLVRFADDVNPPCEICGCSFCEAGQFPVTLPSGIIPIPDDLIDQAPPGFTEVPCSLLDFAAVSGQIPPELCNDDLRLLPVFREVCGCPALPTTEMPVASPTDAPIVAPTGMPIVAPTGMPIVAPTDTPMVAPTGMPIVAPADTPIVAPVAQTDMPVVSPTEAPVVETTAMPIPTSTMDPVNVLPTDPPVERCIRRKRR